MGWKKVPLTKTIQYVGGHIMWGRKWLAWWAQVQHKTLNVHEVMFLSKACVKTASLSLVGTPAVFLWKKFWVWDCEGKIAVIFRLKGGVICWLTMDLNQSGNTCYTEQTCTALIYALNPLLQLLVAVTKQHWDWLCSYHSAWYIENITEYFGLNKLCCGSSMIPAKGILKGKIMDFLLIWSEGGQCD